MRESMQVLFSAEVEPCPYWDFETHTVLHSCNSCECAHEGNSIDNAKSGVMIGIDRYCTLGINIHAELVKAVSASPVKRGRWGKAVESKHDTHTGEYWEEEYYNCLECDYASDWKSPYCPNCGALMED